MAFHHVAIATSNLDAAHRFYTEAMGFRLVHVEAGDAPEGDAWFRHVFYDTGDGSLLALFDLHGDRYVGMDLAISRGLGLPNWVKLEIHPDPRYLLPDPVETFKAAEILVKEGFIVLPYINADPVLAKRLQEIGTATVMPLGSPIGSNRGLETRGQLEIIIEQATVPVVVDAGIGAPSHAAEAMEMGADAVLVNTALAIPTDPVRMARAFRMAVDAGRAAYEIGLGLKLEHASATSPLTAFLKG